MFPGQRRCGSQQHGKKQKSGCSEIMKRARNALAQLSTAG
jgi:hypothetical protein